MTFSADKFRGALLGLAVGDALGAGVEFMERGTFDPVTDMTGGGQFNLKPGEWTDDTSMALCLGASLLKMNAFDPEDQMERYLRWWKYGHMSANGKCFDIGRTVLSALRNYKLTKEGFSGSNDRTSSGNGSIMRLAPVPMFFIDSADAVVHFSGESSRTTHGSPICIDACRYFGLLIYGALTGESKKSLLSSNFQPDGLKTTYSYGAEIEQVARGSFKHKNRAMIKGSGFVVESLEAALWAFFHTDSFKDGCMLAVNLGDDADTTGAVYGQLAGAYYGVNAIPENWLNVLARKGKIESMADRLYFRIKKSLKMAGN